jgi:hypothetical protein
MPVPKLGTYQAVDPNNPGIVQYKFEIKEANPDIGEIRGMYWTEGSRMGKWSSHLGDYPGNAVQWERSSSYSWIARTENGVRINEPPFLLRIVGTSSMTAPAGSRTTFKKCQHSWTGIYHPGGLVRMSGTECYFEFDGETGAATTEPVVLSLPLVDFEFTAPGRTRV